MKYEVRNHDIEFVRFFSIERSWVSYSDKKLWLEVVMRIDCTIIYWNII